MSTMSIGPCFLRLVVVAMMAAAMAALPGCADVSEDTFDRIEVGMKIGEVQSIMGTDGKRTEQGGMSISAGGVMSGRSSAHRDEMFTWESGRRRIIVHTRDGVVVSKHKEGF